MARNFCASRCWCSWRTPHYVCADAVHCRPSNPARAAGGGGEGKQIFATTCAACHGLDGAGGEHGPDISHRREVQGLSDNALQQIIRGGVPGTGMPAFRSLSDTQVKAVVRYLRSLQGQGSNGRGFRRPQEWQGHFLWQGRLFAVPHGEGRGRIHRLGSFQLRQHAFGRATFAMRLPIPTGISILESARWPSPRGRPDPDRSGTE